MAADGAGSQLRQRRCPRQRVQPRLTVALLACCSVRASLTGRASKTARWMQRSGYQHLPLADQAGSAHLGWQQPPSPVRRSLLNAMPDVTVVETGEELVAAFKAQANHIELRSHIDLTSFGKDELGGGKVLGETESVRSMRGNCSSPPPPQLTGMVIGPPLRDLLPLQCLVLVHDEMVRLDVSSWWDSLYLRFIPSVDGLAGPHGDTVHFGVIETDPRRNAPDDLKVFLTDVTIQGGGVDSSLCWTCGLLIFTTSVYAEGCTFANFNGDKVIWVLHRSDLTLVDCTFVDNAVSEGVIRSHTTVSVDFPIVRLEGLTSLVGNAGPPLTTSPSPSGGTFYADNGTSLTVTVIDSERVKVGTASVLPLSEWPAGRGLTADDPFLTNLQQMLGIAQPRTAQPPIAQAPIAQAPIAQAPIAQAPVAATPLPATAPSMNGPGVSPGVSDSAAVQPTSIRDHGSPADVSAEPADSDGRGPGAVLIAGIGVAAAVLLLGVGSLLCWLQRRRVGAAASLRSLPANKRAPDVASFMHVPQQHAHGSGEDMFFLPSAPPAVIQESNGRNGTATSSSTKLQSMTTASTAPSVTMSSLGKAPAVPPWQNAYPNRASDTLVNMTNASQATLVPPGSGASAADRAEFLCEQLDSLIGAKVWQGLVLKEGMHNRIEGGQAVVQFAKEVNSDREFAAKFYVSRAAFQEEKDQYTDHTRPMHELLPELHAIYDNEDGDLVDACGNPLPPCIVMEKGESLDLWCKRSKHGMDTFTCMQVLYHICSALLKLHKAGYAHRDLKPSNIMWLPSQNRWTLIDFGCAAKIGEQARTGFSLTYAAPEAIRAHFRDRASTILVDDALDSWSLGVMAVELFSEEPALCPFEGEQKIVEGILGEEKLPWDDAATARRLLRKAGKLQGAVLELLDRDPRRRLRMKGLLTACSSVMSVTETHHEQPS